MASPDCDLPEPKAGDQRAATMILERNGSRSKQGLPACDPGAVEPPPTVAGGEAFERANLAKSCATHA